MTEQQILPFHEAGFRVPYWCYTLGYMRNSQVLRLIKSRADLIHRAQLDGIEQVAPILLVMGCHPSEARRRVGKSVWKHVHHSPLALNVDRANVMLRTKIRLSDVIEFPSGALREVMSKARATSEAAVTAAGVISTNRTQFREAVMLAHDTIRMGGEINRAWSMRRLREEHDRLALEWARAKSDPTPWAEPFSATVDGFTFTMLNSGADFSAEGATMRHCVASYAMDAKAGRYIIMRIDGKERATVRFGGHPVRVQEVRARFNARVSPACAAACDKFCAEYLTSVPRART